MRLLCIIQESNTTTLQTAPGYAPHSLYPAAETTAKTVFSPETWEFENGEPFDSQTENEILESLKPAYISGLTLLGGDPFEPENQHALLPFVRKVKERYPGKISGRLPVICWTKT